MLEISHVSPDGTACKYGIKQGDRILSINGHNISDCIDFQYFASDEHFVMEIITAAGVKKRIRIVKTSDDTLGLEFPPFSVRRCRNRCVFCFVDQMPRGCRRSLFVKDDDYRASFLFGNYITLGNLKEEDWERIFSQRLSPLYLSVHSTEPELRAFLLRNSKAPDIMTNMRRLAAGGIRMHAQIVLCPGINDGRHLEKTVADLSTLYPSVLSIAAVPVGLTAHRKGLFPLRIYRQNEAKDIVEYLIAAGNRFRRRFKTRLVFPSDELFIKAGVPIPKPEFYEDFPQIENGVGMVSDFLGKTTCIKIPKGFSSTTVSVVTGVSFAPFLRESLKKIKADGKLRIHVIKVENLFFGRSVTVAGLLTGKDIIDAAKGKRLGDTLFIPNTSLKDDEKTFLDNLTIEDIESSLGVPVKPVKYLADIIRFVSTLGGRE